MTKKSKRKRRRAAPGSRASVIGFTDSNAVDQAKAYLDQGRPLGVLSGKALDEEWHGAVRDLVDALALGAPDQVARALQRYSDALSEFASRELTPPEDASEVALNREAARLLTDPDAGNMIGKRYLAYLEQRKRDN